MAAVVVTPVKEATIMRSRLSPTQEFTPDPAANGARPTLKEIPYDFVATFTLTGSAGNRVQDVINTSVDGAFVAVAIGYSFIPATLPALPAVPAPSIEIDSGDDSDDDVDIGRTEDEEGDRQYSSNPVVNWLLADILSPAVASRQTRALMQSLLVRLCGIDFKYSIIDSAVGRELQNIPIHNIAGLGEVNGNRPFRPMAKPMLFMPRSTIRIEVEEISQGPLYESAELYIVLHGYKILGYGTG
jgi:hypothetical protein